MNKQRNRKTRGQHLFEKRRLFVLSFLSKKIPAELNGVPVSLVKFAHFDRFFPLLGASFSVRPSSLKCFGVSRHCRVALYVRRRGVCEISPPADLRTRCRTETSYWLSPASGCSGCR